jgi:nucleotide-binding universal stress UspA family protein
MTHGGGEWRSHLDRDRHAHVDFERILVGVDGSRRGEAAAEFAGRLAGASGARLIVASVYTLRTLGGRLQSGERAAALAHDAATRVARGPFECRIAPSVSPAEGLRAIANAESADLVVLGSRHRGRLGEALAGGVARRLVRGATLPVVLVPEIARVRDLEWIGVLPGAGPEAERTIATAEALAADVGARVKVYRGPRHSGHLSDDLTGGLVSVLVVPAWPHGLAGRLRGHATRAETAGCVLIVVPPAARVPSASVPATAVR